MEGLINSSYTHIKFYRQHIYSSSESVKKTTFKELLVLYYTCMIAGAVAQEGGGVTPSLTKK